MESKPKHSVTRKSDWVLLAEVTGHLGLVFLPVMWAAYSGSVASFVLGCLWLGVVQNGIANMMHEAAHRNLFRSGPWSDFLGTWILGPFFMTSFESYRRRHWTHHEQVGTPDDTKTTYLIRLRGTWSLLAFIGRCLAGIEGVKRFANAQKESRYAKSLSKMHRGRARVAFLVFHIGFALTLVLIALAGSGGDMRRGLLQAGIAYVVVYLYGMLSFTIVLSTLRAIAEHQSVSSNDAVQGVAALRNMAPSPLSRLLFGAYGFCEHATHHRHPSIPHYCLAAVTLELGRDNSSFGYGSSYWRVLAEAIL